MMGLGGQESGWEPHWHDTINELISIHVIYKIGEQRDCDQFFVTHELIVTSSLIFFATEGLTDSDTYETSWKLPVRVQKIHGKKQPSRLNSKNINSDFREIRRISSLP